MAFAWHTFVITKATNVVTWLIDGIPIAAVPRTPLPLAQMSSSALRTFSLARRGFPP